MYKTQLKSYFSPHGRGRRCQISRSYYNRKFKHLCHGMRFSYASNEWKLCPYHRDRSCWMIKRTTTPVFLTSAAREEVNILVVCSPFPTSSIMVQKFTCDGLHILHGYSAWQIMGSLHISKQRHTCHKNFPPSEVMYSVQSIAHTLLSQTRPTWFNFTVPVLFSMRYFESYHHVARAYLPCD